MLRIDTSTNTDLDTRTEDLDVRQTGNSAVVDLALDKCSRVQNKLAGNLEADVLGRRLGIICRLSTSLNSIRNLVTLSLGILTSRSGEMRW